MPTRYIQTSVSEEDHKQFTNFAFNHDPQLTLGNLIEVAIKHYINFKRKGALREEVKAEGSFKDR